MKIKRINKYILIARQRINYIPISSLLCFLFKLYVQNKKKPAPALHSIVDFLTF